MYPSNFRCLIAAGAHTVADLVAEGLVMLAAADNDAENATIHVAVMRTGDRGRPKFLLNTSQLADMLQLHFKVPHIARLFGVSVRTIRRRMKDAGLYVSDLYCTLSDAQLDDVVRNVFQQFPNSGYRMMAGHLRHLNIHVQQLRIRDSLHRISPASLAVRWNETIVRRVYSVHSPLALWHIDGNHKLIRYYCDRIDLKCFNMYCRLVSNNLEA